jgi:hypothetical protein
MVQIYLPPSPAGQTGCASRSTLLAEQALSQNSNLKARGAHTQQSVYSGSVQEDSKRSSIFGKFKTKLGRKKGKQEEGVPVIAARTGQKRDTIQIFPYSNAQSARKSMQSVLSAKVNVSDARAQDLHVLLDRSRTQLAQQRHAFLMQHSGPSAAHGPPIPVLLLNFLPDQVLHSACSLYL